MSEQRSLSYSELDEIQMYAAECLTGAIVERLHPYPTLEDEVSGEGVKRYPFN